MTADDIIARFSLQPHPEGGWYRQTYRSAETISLPRGTRPAATAIYFLLRDDQISALHRIAADELWHFYLGAPLRVESIAPDGQATSFVLGPDLRGGETPQAWVPAGHWFGASLIRGGWALVGCTVAPGFVFEDFEMGEREALLSAYPACADMVRRLTRV